MVDKDGEHDAAAVKELLTRSSYELAALFNILEKKGLVSRAEFLDELKRLHESVPPPADPDPYVIRG